MLWTTLHSKIGKQPLRITNHKHVYAILENPKTHRKEQIFLELRFDSSGCPMFVASDYKSKDRRENYGYY